MIFQIDFNINLFQFFFVFYSFYCPAFCSLLLDWIENENNQNDDGLVLPFSPVMRPSQLSSMQSKNSNSFMDAFMQHLKANERKPDTTPSTLGTVKPIECMPAVVPKQPKKPPSPKESKPARKPREPSVRKPRRKKESNCTTIGLQIQIRDPNTEREAPHPVVYESNKGAYPFNSVGIEAVNAPSIMISNVAENYLPVSSAPSSSSCALNTGQHTYYNMDKTDSEPGEQYLDEPDPVYHVQPMGILSKDCGNGSTASIMHGPDINVSSEGYQIQTPLHPYNMYAEQKGNGHPIISHFNVAHTNVNNGSVVCEPLHNWRAGNEIM